MIREMLYKFITGELASITGALATYPFTSGSATPAVFTTDDIPKDASYPCIHIPSLDGGTDFSVRAYKGGTFNLNVMVYNDRERSTKTIETLAINLRQGIHRGNLASYVPSGWECNGMIAELPRSFVDDDGFPGFAIGVKVTLLQLE